MSKNEKNKKAVQARSIYIASQQDGSWRAECAVESHMQDALPLVEEGTYPVEVTFARTDMNGSMCFCSATCDDEETLLACLQWAGAGCWQLMSLWDWSLDNETNDSTVEIFELAYLARASHTQEHAAAFC